MSQLSDVAKTVSEEVVEKVKDKWNSSKSKVTEELNGARKIQEQDEESLSSFYQGVKQYAKNNPLVAAAGAGLVGVAAGWVLAKMITSARDQNQGAGPLSSMVTKGEASFSRAREGLEQVLSGIRSLVS